MAVTGIIVGLMLLCGGIEGVIALKTNRKELLLPLPILCGMGCVYVFIQTIIVTGWGLLLWYVLQICAVCVLFGTMMGGVIGESKRKKRQTTPSSPKEDL